MDRHIVEDMKEQHDGLNPINNESGKSPVRIVAEAFAAGCFGLAVLSPIVGPVVVLGTGVATCATTDNVQLALAVMAIAEAALFAVGAGGSLFLNRKHLNESQK